jgi:ribosomal protein S12 methylthiotransferase
MIERGLVESTSSETDLLLSGRMWFQAPEIDGALYVTAGDANPGKIYDIKITGVHETDFFGEII